VDAILCLSDGQTVLVALLAPVRAAVFEHNAELQCGASEIGKGQRFRRLAGRELSRGIYLAVLRRHKGHGIESRSHVLVSDNVVDLYVINSDDRGFDDDNNAVFDVIVGNVRFDNNHNGVDNDDVISDNTFVIGNFFNNGCVLNGDFFNNGCALDKFDVRNDSSFAGCRAGRVA
jgi:hypothetical protein